MSGIPNRRRSTAALRPTGPAPTTRTPVLDGNIAHFPISVAPRTRPWLVQRMTAGAETPHSLAPRLAKLPGILANQLIGFHLDRRTAPETVRDEAVRCNGALIGS